MHTPSVPGSAPCRGPSPDASSWSTTLVNPSILDSGSAFARERNGRYKGGVRGEA